MSYKKLVLGVILLLPAIFMQGAYAESTTTDNISVNIPVSCSMTSTIGSAHTAVVELGTYEDEIGETTFSVFCNDAGGFAVYAVGYSDNTYGNTVMKPSVLDASNGIVTGTAISGNTSNWAMKLTAVSGTYAPTLATGFNNYHAIPNEYTKVVSFAANTDSVSGSSFKSTYAAYVSQAQAADTYTGKVKYTIVHPSTPATPENLSIMQNFSPSECTSTPTRVVDNRDNHIYTIQRLADDHCWMMDNLDLGREDLTVDLTSQNTNLVTTISADTFNSWRTTEGTNTTATGEFIPLEGTDPIANTTYGTLYNYYVASAGTVYGDNGAIKTDSDICPAGWRLPTGSTYKEYYSLAIIYNESINSFRSPIHGGGLAFTFSGSFGNGAPSGMGNTGKYWGANRMNDAVDYMTFLSLTKTMVSHGGGGRGYGYSIRCILDEPKSITNLVHLQDFSKLSEEEKSLVVSSMQGNTNYELMDSRYKGVSYSIAKLKDGNLWMTSNLGAIDVSSSYASYINTSTNISENAPISYTTIRNWFKTSGSAALTSGEQIYINDTDTLSGNPYGTLYNYYAASAATIKTSNNSSNAIYDSCPAGWRLPTGGPSGEFNTLVSNYGTIALLRAPVENGGAAMDFAGSFYSGVPTGQGSTGNYWSSTRYDGTDMYYLSLDSNSVDAVAHASRGNGFSMRCVLK